MDELKEQLKRHEGFRQFPYKCSEGYTTVGFGRNLDTVGISEEEAEMLLNGDINKAWKELRRVFPEAWNLTQNRLNVLLNMIFNLGAGGFMTFTNMLQAIRRGDYDSVPDHMLDSRWAKQVGYRALELADQWKKERRTP